jgi:hypothetical protein
MTKKEMLREFGRGITILKNKNVAVAFVVRIINQLSLCASTSSPFLSLTKNIAINPPIKMKINDDHKVPISPMIGIEKLGK